MFRRENSWSEQAIGKWGRGIREKMREGLLFAMEVRREKRLVGRIEAAGVQLWKFKYPFRYVEMSKGLAARSNKSVRILRRLRKSKETRETRQIKFARERDWAFWEGNGSSRKVISLV
jgi:hypothetical protein